MGCIRRIEFYVVERVTTSKPTDTSKGNMVDRLSHGVIIVGPGPIATTPSTIVRFNRYLDRESTGTLSQLMSIHSSLWMSKP